MYHLTRSIYAKVLYLEPSSTLDDVREAVETFEEVERTARRVFGGEHPLARSIGGDLRDARKMLRACESGEVRIGS